MTTQFTISTALPENAKEIQEVSRQSWLVTYPDKDSGITVEDIEERLKDALSQERIDRRAAQIAKSNETEKYFIAKEGEKIVGFCHVVIYPNVNQLHAIYVLPEYTGKGIGTLLWNESLNFFDKTKDTIVHVAVYNKNAINFYKKVGFVDTGKIFSEDRFKMKSGSVIVQTEMVRKA